MRILVWRLFFNNGFFMERLKTNHKVSNAQSRKGFHL